MNEVAKRETPLALPGTLTPTGLELPPGMACEQWLCVMDTLRAMEGVCRWARGDAMLYGIANYGEDAAAQASDEKTASSDISCQWVANSFEKIRRRMSLSWSHHEAVSGMENAVADDWLDQAEEQGLNLKELRAAIRAEKLELAARDNPLPDSMARVLYCDPPWKYNDDRTGLDGYTGAEDHYPTMTLEELCALPVKDTARPDSVMFMWATSPLLDDAIEVMGAWGFTYKTSFVWDKVKHNYGHYNSVRHEMLLIGTRGSCTPDSDELIDSVISIERSDVHSQKPGKFYEIIESMYTDGPYLEMFLRGKPRKGWQGWGNEANSK